MRQVVLIALGAGLSLASPVLAADVGLPISSFVQSWTALPTGRFDAAGENVRFDLQSASVEVVPEAKLGPLIDDAFASARGNAERRNLALSEMAASLDTERRTAFERLRVAAASYAGGDEARHDRFVAMLARVTGRSATVDGPMPAELDRAYAAALSREPGNARVAVEAEQERWRRFSDAFAGFAEARAPGSGTAVTGELERQRLSELTKR